MARKPKLTLQLILIKTAIPIPVPWKHINTSIKGRVKLFLLVP